MSDLISRQAAIDALETVKSCLVEEEHQFLDCLISDMKKLPSAEPERKHEKWIDIDEQTYTWKIRCSCCGYERSMLSTQGKYPNYCEACGADMRENAEPVRHGKWILRTYMPHKNYCSECGKDSPYNSRWDYCPNCGCRMDEE